VVHGLVVAIGAILFFLKMLFSVPMLLGASSAKGIRIVVQNRISCDGEREGDNRSGALKQRRYSAVFGLLRIA